MHSARPVPKFRAELQACLEEPGALPLKAVTVDATAKPQTLVYMGLHADYSEDFFEGPQSLNNEQVSLLFSVYLRAIKVTGVRLSTQA